jgi:uncharacterized delta-60 repeat protein
MMMNTNSRSIILAISLFFALAIPAAAAPGELDSRFGTGGIVYTPITDSAFYLGTLTMRVQPDGKVVVGGRIYDDDADNDASFFIARYNPNGTLDTSFGADGKVVGPYYSGAAMVANAIALQADGKIIAVGFGFDGGNGFAVYRYNANGTLDMSFGKDGKVITTVGSRFGIARSVEVQPDGKIVVAGNAESMEGISDFAVVRYHPDGSLDTSFNGTGKVVTSFGNYAEAFRGVLQPDGKIVVAGNAKTGQSSSAYAVVRYNTDGSLDPSFGADGIVLHALSLGISSLRDVVLQPDGKIVASGWIYNEGAGIVRYNANGSIDTSFAANGIFRTPENFNIGNGIALQSDGKLVAFGYALADHTAGIAGFAIARLNPNGTWDTGFGTNGRVTTPNGKAIGDGAVQPDGKILAVGAIYRAVDIALVRYLGDSAAPPPTRFDFDGDGKADISVFRPSDSVWYLNRSNEGFTSAQFGISTDMIMPADYDGDGRTDIAVFRPSEGRWYIFNSASRTFTTEDWGAAGDLPVPADYDGDKRADLAVFRPSNGTWYRKLSNENQFSILQFGTAEDKPQLGDYDGDGKADMVVRRPSNNVWYLLRTTAGFTAFQWGESGDVAAPADYDGDGKTDVAVFRPFTGLWYVAGSSTGFATKSWGAHGDIPVAADYDGDGRADFAVYRPSDRTWYQFRSTAGILITQFGDAADKPAQSAFVY